MLVVITGEGHVERVIMQGYQQGKVDAPKRVDCPIEL
jgi:hypothetical protein